MNRLFGSIHEYEAHQRRVRGGQAPREQPSSVRFILPFPPSVNHSGADSFRGGRKSDEYLSFMARVVEVAISHGQPRIEGRLAVSVELVPPDRRRFDLDNRLKALLDALQHSGVYRDDEAIDDLRIRRYPCNVPGEGSCAVTVSRVGA